MDYNPQIELINKYFDKDADYLNFKFQPDKIKKKQFDQSRFEEFVEFCNKWGIVTSHASTMYYNANRCQPPKLLDAYRQISKNSRQSKRNGYNFRSDAETGLAVGYERYFKAHGILQGEAKVRHLAIGRLIMLSGIPLSVNRQSLPERQFPSTGNSRIDIENLDSDSELLQKNISEIVRNRVKRKV